MKKRTQATINNPAGTSTQGTPQRGLTKQSQMTIEDLPQVSSQVTPQRGRSEERIETTSEESSQRGRNERRNEKRARRQALNDSSPCVERGQRRSIATSFMSFSLSKPLN